ncbi:MAG: hypothetical protein GY714_02905 [Desulfobacterales bacterium]|nr:hypothetical protein [Desulfobacterales bacterium]
MESYFQIASKEKHIDILEKCFHQLINSEIEIENTEKFDTENLVGYNIYIESVDSKKEKLWSKTIEKIVNSFESKIQLRLRFFNSKTK